MEEKSKSSKPRMSHALQAIQQKLGDWLYSPDLKWGTYRVTHDGIKELFLACTIPPHIVPHEKELMEYLTHHEIFGCQIVERDQNGKHVEALFVPEDQIDLIRLQVQYNGADRDFKYDKAKDWIPDESRTRGR